MATKPELIRANQNKDEQIRQLLEIVKNHTQPVTSQAPFAVSTTPLVVTNEPDYDEDEYLEGFTEGLASFQPVPYTDEACVAVGAVVLMLENRLDFLPVRTGADLATYAEQAEAIHKLHSWLTSVLHSEDGGPVTEMGAANFWTEATELYDGLTH
jgi:hypothetical protein